MHDGRCDHQGGNEEGVTKDANVHLVSIPGFDEALEFYIVKRNFQVNIDPEIVFESKVRKVMPAASPPPVDEEHASLKNVVPNVFGGSKEIQQLWAEGIEVDDDNKPLPMDPKPPPPEPEGTQYNYQKPTFCPHQVENMPNDPGRWKHHRWDESAAKSNFKLFRMCMPEKIICEVVIPAANVTLTPHLTILEFYKWLGCHFFMACFQGVAD